MINTLIDLAIEKVTDGLKKLVQKNSRGNRIRSLSDRDIDRLSVPRIRDRKSNSRLSLPENFQHPRNASTPMWQHRISRIESLVGGFEI